ncbi:MAG: glutathione S-transferase domain-containing protein [Alphaproteobacteria bacterium]|jgi:glutathione S-transferase|nr:glutathione S-transferase domain-containing protein [Alphaproteobacteria bacterium]MDP6565629.1 glutathione S-transferase domain-containing protein [Alphaproteobacteria bacterium]MDP6813244.1 glutathione S-transferase domain-containing protein [Alphaproteobacteria bacterium]
MIRRYVLQYIFPKGADGQPDRAVIDPALEQIANYLSIIDDGLAEHDFLAGDQVSSADLFLAPIMTYLSRMPEGGELLADCANIRRAGGAMTQRASYQDTLPPPPKEAAAE